MTKEAGAYHGVKIASSSNGVGRSGQLNPPPKKERKKLNHQLTPYTKINSRWIKDLNISRDTIKVSQLIGKKIIGRKISDIPYSNFLSDMSPIGMYIKERINKWDLIKLKIFSMAKENSIKMKKRTNCMGKHICQ